MRASEGETVCSAVAAAGGGDASASASGTRVCSSFATDLIFVGLRNLRFEEAAMAKILILFWNRTHGNCNRIGLKLDDDEVRRIWELGVEIENAESEAIVVYYQLSVGEKWVYGAINLYP